MPAVFGKWRKIRVSSDLAGELPPKVDKDYVCKKCPFAWHCRPELGTTVNHEQKRSFT